MPDTKHSPQIRLQAASREYELAQQACPHWDYEHHEGRANCCDELEDAQRRLSNAQKAARS